jgi:hypothetical protein
MTRLSTLAALLLALTAAPSCARASPRSPAPRGDGHLTVVAGGVARQIKLEGPHLYGPRLNVSFFEDGYRGFYDQRKVVDLRPVGGHEVKGTIGGRPTELYVEEGPSWLRVRGLHKGRVGSFVLTPDRAQGVVGDCMFTLRATHDAEPTTYFGGSTCGPWALGTRLTLPEGFDERPARERAVALVLLLGAP